MRCILPNECREEIEANCARAREAADIAKRKKMEMDCGGGAGTIDVVNSEKRKSENQRSASGGKKKGEEHRK